MLGYMSEQQGACAGNAALAEHKTQQQPEQRLARQKGGNVFAQAMQPWQSTRPSSSLGNAWQCLAMQKSREVLVQAAQPWQSTRPSSSLSSAWPYE